MIKLALEPKKLQEKRIMKEMEKLHFTIEKSKRKTSGLAE